MARYASAWLPQPQPRGKNVVVIGAGNTASDICEDLAVGGVSSVTMVQRSSTCVVSRSNIKTILDMTWPDGVPVDISDFKFASMPLGCIKEYNQMTQDQQWEMEKELHAKLRKAGFSVWLGPEGEGQFIVGSSRGGGKSF